MILRENVPLAPRSVPLAKAWGYAWVALVIGGIFFAIFAAILAAVSIVFGLDIDGERDAKIDASDRFTSGTISRISAPGLHIGSRRVLRFEFVYSLGDGVEHHGESFAWSDQVNYRSGQNVAVDYVEDQPELARLENTKLNVLSRSAYYAPLGLGLVALLFFVWGLLRARARQRLLATGSVVDAIAISTRRLSYINPTPLVVRYQCEDPLTGQALQGTAWLVAKRVKAPSGQFPHPCLVAVDETGSGKHRLLAFGNWCAVDISA